MQLIYGKMSNRNEHMCSLVHKMLLLSIAKFHKNMPGCDVNYTKRPLRLVLGWIVGNIAVKGLGLANHHEPGKT